MILPAISYLPQLDIIYAILAIVLASLLGYFYKRFFHSDDPRYRYFVPGIVIKMFGGFLFVLVYTYYYTTGGDTQMYFESAKCLSKLTWIRPWQVLQMLSGMNTPEMRSFFDYNTGIPFDYIFSDSKQWAVCCFSYPFVFISGNRFILATVLIDAFAYIGIWQFFLMLGKKYPDMLSKLAIACMLIPSAVFWGSGIMKDTYTFSATLWLIAAFYKLFFEKRDIRNQLLIVFLNAYMILSIKPYIFAALIPALMIWIGIGRIYKISNRVLRLIIAPIIFLALFSIGALTFSFLSSSLGKYGTIESALEKAELTKEDLTQEKYYGANFYDVGEFDANISSVLGKVPIALWYGIYGPFIWSARSPILLISASESFLFLLLTIIILYRTKVRKLLSIVRQDDYLLFALCFSLLFLFFVGLSSGNYGAMVRYRIPGLPMFLSFLFIVNHKISFNKRTTKNKNL